MNIKYLLSIGLLLSVSPIVYAQSECAETRQARQMDSMVRTQEDMKAALAFMLIRNLPVTGPVMGEVVSRTGKCCMRQIVVNNTPFPELRVELPGMGPVEVLNAEQAFEVGYSAYMTLLDASVTPQQRNDALLLATCRTYVREKLLAAFNWMLANSGLGECPVSPEVRSHCVTKNAVEETKRYVLDRVVNEVFRQVRR